MKRIVIFGSIGLARKILDGIIRKKDVQIVGVCCEQIVNSWRAEEDMYSYCVREAIPIIDQDSIPDLQPDIGFSLRYNKIIDKKIITAFSKGIINTHGGILPEYRGSYCNINAIINGEEEYGVTLHYIDQGIDTGDIIAIEKVTIEETYTGMDLYKISEELSYLIIKKNIDDILAQRNVRVPQKKLIEQGHSCNAYTTRSTFSMKKITFSDLCTDKGLRIIRAFDSDFHEPAYLESGNKRVYLRVNHCGTNLNGIIKKQ